MNTRKNRWSRPLAALLAVIMLLGAAPAAWADDLPETKTTADLADTQTPVAVGIDFIGERSVEVGKDITLNAIVKASDGTDSIAQDVRWDSSNPAVATVDDSGRVSGKSKGTVSITATSTKAVDKDGKAVSGNVQITVTEVYVDETKVTGVSVSPSAVTLHISDIATDQASRDLKATITPSTAAAYNPVVWSTSNPAVVDVDPSTGRITALSRGTATITAIAGNVSGNCTVTVTQAVSGVTLSATALELRVGGEPVGLTASILPADADNKSVSWTSSNPAIASVDSSGRVTGVATGSATITVTTGDGGYKATCAITVKEGTKKVTGVTVSPASQTMVVNDTLQLKAEVAPTDAANKNVVWSSSSPNVASVSATGLVTAKSAGTVNITAASAEDNTKIGTCVVTVTNTGITLGSTTLNLQTGKSSTLRATTIPANVSNTVTWSSSNTSVVTVGTTTAGAATAVYAVGPGSAVVTATLRYNSKTFTAQCRVTVTKSLASTITYRVDEGRQVNFNDANFNDVCLGLGGYTTLEYVRFTTIPSSTYGTLYYDYGSSSNTQVNAQTNYYYRGYRSRYPYIDSVTFVPRAGYTGTFAINYTGWDINGKDFTGQIEITVGYYGGNGDIEYTTDRDTPLNLEDMDFNSYSRKYAGNDFDYVEFTSLPLSSKGTLYYDYSPSSRNNTKVNRNTAYYRSRSPYLDYVTFVPDEDFTGTVTIPFVGYDIYDRKFSGDLTITVGGGDEITYTTNKNTAVDLLERDFVNYSRDQAGNSTFDYIQFTTLPSASKGTLYYDYAVSSRSNEAVGRNTRYYRTRSPYLQYITFVPANNYTGTVTIPFTGESDSGRRFSGDLKITVGSGGEITYTATAGQDVSFRDGDFNSYCKDETGANLDFVQFTLPSSAQGALYSGTKKAASSSTRYYRSSPAPYLNDVSFAPAKSTTTVRIPFTGESVKGDRISGTVVISFTAAPGVIKYSSNGGAVTFKTKDFSDVCTNRGGRAALSSVKFDAASTNSGKLYASYVNGAGSTVNTSTAYKVSGSPSLGNVTFVPKSGYSGKVNLTYTATDANGDTYRGTVEITVTPTAASTNFKDMGNHSWAASSVDFLSRSGVVTGVDSTHYGPANPMTRGDFVLMLYRAFNMKSSGKVSFSDVPQNSYYAEAIAAAKALGIATGTNNKFNPNAPLTRQDAMVLIQRTMSATGRPLTAGDTSTLNSFKDRNRVSDYAVNAVAALVRSGLIKGDDGRINPSNTITRAEMAVLLHRVLTM